MSEVPSNFGGWEEHEKAQLQQWLSLSYEQRLDWLAQAKEFVRMYGGLANPTGATIDPQRPRELTRWGDSFEAAAALQQFLKDEET